jgi:hypothetical protein
MIAKILQHEVLSKFICEDAKENDFGIDIDVSVKKEDILIIKIDDYYKSLNLALTPPSIDFIVIQRCSSNYYQVFLIEAKNIADKSGFDPSQIEQKFKTTVNDFINSKFYEVFCKYSTIKDWHLYFVSDPYDLREFSEKHPKYKKMMEESKLSYFLKLRPFKICGEIFLLKYKTPNPLVTIC